MTNICHLFDSSAGWEQRLGVLQLIDRMPHDRFRHTLAAINRAAVTGLSPCSQLVEMIARCAGSGLLAARALCARRNMPTQAWNMVPGTAMLAAWPITLDPIFGGLAWALMFGLFVSTVFTLVVIPGVYYIVCGRRATA